MTHRKVALKILTDFEGQHNRDGVGSAHIDPRTGEFVVVKYPTSLSHVLRKKRAFLNHMPHPGWTIAHLRAASHGDITMENTHPFIVGREGEWCICHNGIWRAHRIARVIMEQAMGIKFQGQTDTEAAANLFALLGPQAFAESVGEMAGVYLALNKDGTLWAVKTSGQLEVVESQRVIGGESVDQAMLASAFPWRDYPYGTRREVPPGYYHFDPRGTLLKKNHLRFIDPIMEARRSIVSASRVIEDPDFHRAHGPYDEDLAQGLDGPTENLTQAEIEAEQEFEQGGGGMVVQTFPENHPSHKPQSKISRVQRGTYVFPKPASPVGLRGPNSSLIRRGPNSVHHVGLDGE